MNSHPLTFKAGPGALKSIKSHGFDPAAVGTLAGASGGAKWLALSQLDRAIIKGVLPQLDGPVHTIGTSIGAWRFACYAQDEPLAAIARFENAYIEQTFSASPDIHEITRKSRDIIDVVLGEHGAARAVSHPVLRSHIMAVRSRHLLASENKFVLGSGLALAAAMNAISRRTLGLFFERALFVDERDKPAFFDASGFPIQRIPMTAENFADAVVATGSIPLVLSGVANIAGALQGVYRDGGIIDYHHDLEHSAADKLTLYPHFYGHMTPGWFDKRLPWRRPAAAHTDRTVLISPSAEFVARLPDAKIPDRSDFVKIGEAERKKRWWQCVADCEALHDDFLEVLASESLAERVQPLY